MERQFPEALVVYLKGFCMGTADAVPGVSGGTIALITGIYERLIRAVTAITADRVVDVVVGAVTLDRERVLGTVVAMDGWFLLTLVAGVMTAVVTVTRALEVAIEEVPVLTFGFFFGLIGASAYVLIDEVSLDTAGRAVAALAGFTVAFVVSGRVTGDGAAGLLVVFVAGAIAVSAMILPGLSGSLLLIILGQYEFMVDTLKQFVDRTLAVVTGGDVAAVADPGVVVFTFVSGAVVGLFTVSHAVRWALDNYREATLAFLVSLIVGALRAPVANTGGKLAESGRTWSPELVGAFAVAALVGAVVVVGVERVGGGVEY